MKNVFALLSGLIIFGTAVPYLIDIAKNKVKPVRSTWLMFLFLLVLAFFQQREIGVGLAMIITIAELAATLLLFVLSMFKGEGGFSRLDKACYILLVVGLVVWKVSGSPILGLAMTILTDFVAFFPVIYRTAKDPKSETQIFYWGGVLGPIFGLLAVTDRSFNKVVFIVYLAAVNMLVALLINRQYLKKSMVL
jgi:MFS family permease